MKTIAADTLLVQVVGQSEAGLERVDRLVKGRVEAADLRDVWKGFHEGLDPCQIVGLVQWRQAVQPFQFSQNAWAELHRLSVQRAAVNDAVGHRHQGALPEQGADQLVQHLQRSPNGRLPAHRHRLAAAHPIGLQGQARLPPGSRPSKTPVTWARWTCSSGVTV